MNLHNFYGEAGNLLSHCASTGLILAFSASALSPSLRSKNLSAWARACSESIIQSSLYWRRRPKTYRLEPSLLFRVRHARSAAQCKDDEPGADNPDREQ